MPDYATFHSIEVTHHEVLSCSYSKWAPKFPRNTAKSRIISPLPKAFLQYLASDSIKLANNGETIEANSDNEYSDWESDSEGETGADTGPAVTISDFSELHSQIEAEITALGGKIAPKLNWSAPKDARWIMPGNTMKCASTDDVYLLLNASDHVVDDLDYPFSAVETKENDQTPEVNYELVLRQWLDINPALEFRVFVYQGRILGVSQRDLNHYVFLESLQEQLREVIEEFVEDEVVEKLQALGLEKYILDVYVPRPFKKVYLVDVNPFTRKSDSLLFTWHELLEEAQKSVAPVSSGNGNDQKESGNSGNSSIGSSGFGGGSRTQAEVSADPELTKISDTSAVKPSEIQESHGIQSEPEELSNDGNYEFRIITQTNVGRFAQKEYSESQVPLDIVDASLNAATMAELAREWGQLQVQQDR